MSEQQEHLDTGLISGAIARAQRGLEQVTADADGQTLLNHCRADIQQIHSALPAQSPARSLTRAMLPVLDSLMANLQGVADEHTRKQQAKLIAALKHLPACIVSGADSQLPTLLKELRQLQRGPQKNWRMPGLITSGLVPDYLQPTTDTAPIEQSQLETLQDSGFAATVRKIRQKYQLCLASVIRGSQRQEQLAVIGKLFAKLQNLCWDSPLSPLWEAGNAFCQGLQEGTIALDNEAIRLLGDIDHELRYLVDEETARLNNPPPQTLFALMLQRLREADSNNPLILSIQQRYTLQETKEQEAKEPPRPTKKKKPHFISRQKAPADNSTSDCSEGFCPQSTYEIFAAQTTEVVQQLATELPKWRCDFTDQVAASRIRRACHSLKGHGRIIGADVIGELAWSLENMLDSVINGTITASEAMADLLDDVITMLPELVHDFVDNSQQLTPEVLMCMEKADALAAGDHYDFDDEPEDMDDLQDSPMMFGHVVAAPEEDNEAKAAAQTPLQTVQSATDELHWLSNAADHLTHWIDRIPPAELQQCQQELKAVVENAHNLEQHELAQLGDVLLDICVYLETYEGNLPAQLLVPLNDGFTTLLAMINQEGQASPQGVFGGLCDALESLLLGQPVNGSPIPEPVPQSAPDELQEPSASIPLPDYLGHNHPGQSDTRTPVTTLADKPAIDTPQELPSPARTAPAHELIQISTQRLETLINIAEESGINRTCIEQQLSETVQAIEEMSRTVVRLREQFRRLDCEIQTHPQSSENPQLPLLSNLLAESTSDLMELHGMLQQKTRTAGILLQQQARTQTELHEYLLKTRMVPFNQLVPRLRTFVHRICTELNKPVELLVRGGEEALDKTTLEQILPTLEHLLRNAIDHGIEDSADVRRKAGKPAEGQISLTIHRDGMAVVVALADDGRGINIGAVQARAAAQQLISPHEPVDMKRASKLIMQPGFNTTASTAPLSAIDLEIRQLGGSVALHSEAGQGTHITLRLPFTQSIHRVLMVTVAGNHYALPMHTIDEITMMPASELSASSGSQTIDANGTQYRLIHLGDLLGNARMRAARGQRPVVLIRRDNDHIAIEVDAIDGSREIISKSLGAPFSALTGVTGATIAGDGQVVIILDPLALYHKHLITPTTPQQPDSSHLDVQVMVVDDSITARKTTSQLLAQHGYQVITARDGTEALAVLAEQQPDILLVDTEMPHMDGFGLVSALRDNPALAHLPVIMMAGEQHRAHALELGVSELVAKPFREKQLLSAIELLTERVGC